MQTQEQLLKKIIRYTLLEYVVPIGFSLEHWKRYRKKHGITNADYHREHPEKKWKVVHGHKKGEIGKPLPGLNKISYNKATKAHSAIAMNEQYEYITSILGIQIPLEESGQVQLSEELKDLPLREYIKRTLFENWREYLNEDKKNNYHALLIIEAAETNNEDLFFENLIYLNEGVLDKMKEFFFDKPVEVLAELIGKIGSWVARAFEWAAIKVPDEWSGLKTLANTVQKLVLNITSHRMALQIASTLVKMAYVALLFKAVAMAVAAAGVGTAAGSAGAAVAKAASHGQTAIDVLQSSLTGGDPNSMAQGAAKAIEHAQNALKTLEGAKLLGFASGKLSMKRGISVLGKRLFKGDVGVDPSDVLKALAGLDEERTLFENWREYLTEEDENASQFRLVKPTLLRLTTEQDRTTRDILIVEHPDATVKAYFKSSGVSGGGYKGDWIPFEGWVTDERVPKGQTFTDGGGTARTYEKGTLTLDQPYGHYAIMAKTYWDVGGAKPPTGSIHDQAAQWIKTLDNLPDDQKPTVKTITVGRGVNNNIAFFGKANRQLDGLGAINPDARVLNTNSDGRRIQFGLDKES